MNKIIFFVLLILTLCFTNIYSNERHINNLQTYSNSLNKYSNTNGELFSFKIKFGKDAKYNSKKILSYYNNIPINTYGYGIFLSIFVGIPLLVYGGIAAIIGIPFLAVGAYYLNRPDDTTLTQVQKIAFTAAGGSCLGSGILLIIPGIIVTVWGAFN